MKYLKSKRTSQADLRSERRWGHPLLEFARWLAGTGFWICHFVIATTLIALVLLTLFDVTVHRIAATLGTMIFGVVLLLGFVGWTARSKR